MTNNPFAPDDNVPTRLVPLGELRPAPWNPRLIRDFRFKMLCKSMQRDPDAMWDDPILARADGEIYQGNMRYRAAEHLGWSVIPAKMREIDILLAKERGIRDNNHFGEWDEDALGALLGDFQVADVDLTTLGFEVDHLTRIMDSTGLLGDTQPFIDLPVQHADKAKVTTCPKCGYEWTP